MAEASFVKALVPYKRVLAVLLRPSCISLAVSNPYQSLAEPAGAVLLRDGKVPERILQRLFEKQAPELTGVLWGCEQLSLKQQVLQDPHASATLQQVQAVLSKVCPNLPTSWYSQWSPDAPESCRILPPGGPSAARHDMTEATQSLVPGVQEGSQGAGESADRQQPGIATQQTAGGPPCSKAGLFLQHWLDSLGSHNTFG